MTQKPTIGRIVHYTLAAADAEKINKRQLDGGNLVPGESTTLARHDLGAVIHSGNSVNEGDAFPMMITRVWGDTPSSAVNGQVMLDGNDTAWVTSVSEGTGPGHFVWPTRS